MKKFISLVLIFTLLCSFTCIGVFANDVVQRNNNNFTEYVENVEIDNQAVHEHGAECEEIMPTQVNDPKFIPESALQKAGKKDFGDVTFNFNESALSFSEKIIKNNYDLDGNVVSEDDTTKDISTYFEEKQASRFDIIDVAHENNIISEYEKISSYCEVYELGYFENVDCLHEVVVELYDYFLHDNTPDYVKNEIASVLLLSDSNEILYSDSTNNTYNEYQSSNFVISYASGILLSEVKKTANYLEEIRTNYINMGFKEPIKETGYTKYRVFLESSSNPTATATTHPVVSYGVTCSTYIKVFTFSSLTTAIKERIAHEYFHAIQGAYMWSNTNVWFDEAMANWGKITVAKSSSTCNGQINTFLRSTDSIYSEDSSGYGVVLFPLAIHYACGIDAIRSIWEEYGKQTSQNLTFDQLKEDVVDEALRPYNQSFNGVFFKMGYLNFKPSRWYTSVHPGGYSATQSWTERITTTTNTISAPRRTQTACTNQTIQSYSNNYHKFVPDVLGKESKLTITVTFSGSNASQGVCQSYYEKTDGTHVARNLNKSGDNTYTIISDLYGGEISWFGVVVSNVADNSINYTIKYKVERGSKSSVSFSANQRYSEFTMNLGIGEYKDYIISFSKGGNKIIQTFGAHTSSKDGYLELFDMNGKKLTGNDDSGYERNALISYNFNSNTQYRLRVTFFNTSHSGNVKIGIMPTYSMSTYEDIYYLEDYTSRLNWNFAQNNVKLLTYKFSTTKELTMHVSSKVDTYLYIIDPRSTKSICAASISSPNNTKGCACLYNDDINGSLDRNSQITKTFDAGVPYLVIVSAYNPSLSTSVGSFCINFLN